MEYEICSDPFDPRCVSPSSMYLPGDEPEEAKLLLERIRGKTKDDTIREYTRDEEYDLINEQIISSQGFDVDFSKFRVLFDFYPSFLDESHSTLRTETDRDYFGRLAKEAIEDYNQREGTSFEFVEVEKANVYRTSGYTYFITFLVKDPCDGDRKITFQAKVRNVLCRDIVHSFCRPKPDQEEVKCDEDSKRLVKKPRIQD